MTAWSARVAASLVLALLGAAPAPAWAVVLGMADTFEAGAADGWFSGGGNPNPPLVVAGGGPAGAG